MINATGSRWHRHTASCAATSARLPRVQGAPRLRQRRPGCGCLSCPRHAGALETRSAPVPLSPGAALDVRPSWPNGGNAASDPLMDPVPTQIRHRLRWRPNTGATAAHDGKPACGRSLDQHTGRCGGEASLNWLPGLLIDRLTFRLRPRYKWNAVPPSIGSQCRKAPWSIL